MYVEVDVATRLRVEPAALDLDYVLGHVNGGHVIGVDYVRHVGKDVPALRIVIVDVYRPEHVGIVHT